MSLITLILMLVVVAVVIYAVRLAMAGNWRELIITGVILVLSLWVLSAMGITLPALPSLK